MKHKQTDADYLNGKYVILTNTLGDPVLCHKTSRWVNDVEEATADWDTEAPAGKGRIFTFTEGMQKWATQGGKYSVAPMAATDKEQLSLQSDKQRILAYAASLGVSDLVADNLADGCDGWPKPDGLTIYDKNGMRIS